MPRVILAFLILTMIFWFGIRAFRQTTGKQKWNLTKLLAYSILCAVLSLAVLISIVILF